MRDYYSEEIGTSAPERDYFTEELIKNKPDKVENIFQKIAKGITNIDPNQAGYAASDPAFPGRLGMGIGFEASDGKFSDAMNPAVQAEGIREEIVGDNFLTDIATDPMTMAGGVKGVSSLTKGIGRLSKNISNPSTIFGKKISKLEKANPGKKVDFLGIISKSLDDPMAKKVLDKSGVVGKYGGATLKEGGAVSDNLANLTLQESQDLVNAVKSGVRQAVKEGVVKPTEIGIAKMFSELSKAQRQAFKGFDKAQKRYGTAKNVQKFAKKYGKQALSGAATGIGLGSAGKVAWDLLN